jgi:hypothetical protein
MEDDDLIFAKQMAQSIIQDGFVRDVNLFNNISAILKKTNDDPEAKLLYNRINLIRISNLHQAKINSPISTQNIAPIEDKISAPAQNMDLSLEQGNEAKKLFPAVLWLLPILLGFPGAICASLIAKKKYQATWWGLFVVGILTTISIAAIIYINIKYSIKF